MSGPYSRFAFLFVGRRADGEDYSGAAPLGAPLVDAVHKKMKSVGADTAILQG